MSSLTRVAPELPVSDLAEALEYYTARLGFEVASVLPSREYAIVERDDVALARPRAARYCRPVGRVLTKSSGLEETMA